MVATATLRGLAMGAGSVYRWATWPAGLMDTPNVRVDDKPRPQQHGIVPGNEYLDGREIVFDIAVVEADRASAEGSLALLAEAFAPSQTDLALTVTISGTPSEFTLYGRPRGVITRQEDRRFNAGTISARATFMCTDPLKYGSTQSEQASMNATTDGLVFSAVAPFVFGSASTSGTVTCVNSGTIDAPFTATFAGPLTAPVLRNSDTGQVIDLSSATLVAGDQLVVNTRDKTVLFNGASRYNWLASNSQWYDLAPGSNNLQLNGASGSGDVTITWASTWV